MGWGSGPTENHRTMLEALETAVHADSGELVNDPSDLAIGDQIDVLENVQHDALVAIGGDGTVNAGASLACRANASLAIVPMGTMNLLAGDFGGFEYPHTISLGVTKRVDVGTVNGHRFLHSAVIGVVPEMARHRESVRRDSSLLNKIVKAADAGIAALSDEPVSLRIQTEFGSTSTSTRSVVVSNNPLSGEGLFDHQRSSIDGDCLGLYISNHEGVLAPLENLLSIGAGVLPNDPAVLRGTCRNVRITPDRDSLPITIDGELREISGPLDFRVEHNALSVVVPPTTPGGVS